MGLKGEGDGKTFSKTGEVLFPKIGKYFHKIGRESNTKKCKIISYCLPSGDFFKFKTLGFPRLMDRRGTSTFSNAETG